MAQHGNITIHGINDATSYETFAMYIQGVLAERTTVVDTSRIHVNVAVDSSELVKPQLRTMVFELLCGLLNTTDAAVARDWLVAKVAQYRGMSESDVDMWMKSQGY